MKRPIPPADPVAMARMKYELENRENPGFMHHFWGIFRTGPDVHLAAKSGTPAMTAMQPGIPVSVPPVGPMGAQAPGGGERGRFGLHGNRLHGARQQSRRPQESARAGNRATGWNGAAPQARRIRPRRRISLEMSRILLADDSPHAQRMGERILTGEGFEVVTVSDGDSALVRLEDADPDLVLADIVMPKRSGYEICQYVKISPRHRHTRVVLTAGVQDKVDEAEVARVGPMV